jgi:acyl dehydratase
MTTTELHRLQPGDTIPELRLPPISRKTLAVYAGASGDHHPLHIDLDYARDAGFPDVFAHGMLSAAYLGRLITNWAGQHRLRSLKMRFMGITHLYDEPHCTGRVAERFEADGETRLRIEMQCENQKGEAKIVGEAIVAIT